MEVNKALQNTELPLELSPAELLVIANQALGRLEEQAWLFGRGNEIDLHKAQELVNMVLHCVVNNELFEAGKLK
jgi:hypothetical protein